jgi:hypothetical protein
MIQAAVKPQYTKIPVKLTEKQFNEFILPYLSLDVQVFVNFFQLRRWKKNLILKIRPVFLRLDFFPPWI